jgi:glycosyltransferase involved in cell wall biosynthesis
VPKESSIRVRPVSIIIPTFNGARRIGACLDALRAQTYPGGFEILVVDDGSSDEIAAVVQAYAEVRLIRQRNAGPAAARNRGARESSGAIILFTDDDCVPTPGWIEAMLAPFADPEVVGAKGAYRTRQTAMAARFVQIEYEDRYRIMAGFSEIDFIDTYSAAYRRDRFLEMGGYDTSFPVACAEDAELSYRMSARRWTMKFAPQAIVYHTHPDTFISYLRKKYKFAFWRMLAVRKNPNKGIKDSHTPQMMKLQLLLLPALLSALALDVFEGSKLVWSLAVLVAFLLSTLPFTFRAVRKDPAVGMLCPLLLAARSCAQFAGVGSGMIHAMRNPEVLAKSPESEI